MARFTLFAVTVMAVALMAVSAARVEISDSGESGRCGGHQMGRQRLTSCREYLRDSSRCESTIMPENESGRGWREAFPRCCEELEQINQQCRCQAVNQAVEQAQQEEGRLGGRERREMLRTAQSLTSLCRISPQSCEVVYAEPAFTTTF